jgi:hypothetical protein
MEKWTDYIQIVRCIKISIQKCNFLTAYKKSAHILTVFEQPDINLPSIEAIYAIGY